MKSVNYKVTHSITGDPLWKMLDANGSIADISEIMDEFMSTYSDQIQGWSLSIYDTITQSTIEIDADIREFSKIVTYIYDLEHAAPLDFIGLNSLTNSIVVGMPLCKGRITPGHHYKAENGKIIQLDIIQ